MTLALLAAGVAVGSWLIVARRLLLAWYLLEVWDFDFPRAPETAIITYPLA